MVEHAKQENKLSKSDREQAEDLERLLLGRIHDGEPDAPHEMTHLFAPGVYWREIKMFKGTVLIGREHTQTHFNVILEGSASVVIEGKTQLIKAPCVFVSEAGVRKILHIHEDMRWATVHANPSDITNIGDLEDWISVKSPVELEHEKSMKIQGRETSCLSG